MSNLIKSGFVAFSKNNTLVIDANENKIIKGIDEAIEETAASLEEMLAESMIRDAGLDDDEKEALLTVDPEDLQAASGNISNIADEIVKSAKAEADEIIAKAHEEVEQLRATVYDEAQKLKMQAKEEGYQEGYQNGSDAAISEYEIKKAELEEQICQSKVVLAEKEAELVKITEQKMVDLLCQLIPTITGVVIEEQKDVLLYMINVAMQDLDNSRHFVVKVSGDDYENIAEQKEEIYGALNPNIDIEIFEDAKLLPMQCLIETDNGIVDISLDVQLDNLKKALKLMVQE